MDQVPRRLNLLGQGQIGPPGNVRCQIDTALPRNADGRHPHGQRLHQERNSASSALARSFQRICIAIQADDDAFAIKAARAHLQGTIEEKPTLRNASIGVGRGEPDGIVQWLGVWDWTDDDVWAWSPDI